MLEVTCETVTAVAGLVARDRGIDLDGTRLICTAEQSIPSQGEGVSRWILVVLAGAAPLRPTPGEGRVNGSSPGSGRASSRVAQIQPRQPAMASLTNTFRFPGQRGVYGRVPSGGAAAAAALAPARPEPAATPAPAPRASTPGVGRYFAIDWHSRSVHVAIDGRDKYCHWMSHLASPDLVKNDATSRAYDLRSRGERLQLRVGEEWYVVG